MLGGSTSTVNIRNPVYVRGELAHSLKLNHLATDVYLPSFRAVTLFLVYFEPIPNLLCIAPSLL